MTKQVQLLGVVKLDYSGATNIEKLINNLSGVSLDDGLLWTASDEGRTVECLEPAGDGFILRRQYTLEEVFGAVPEGKEADLESIEAVGGRVWLCGAHCRVRKKENSEGDLSAEFGSRPSRHVFGTFPAGAAKRSSAPRGRTMPFQGDGSLRRILRADPFLGPFLRIPSKENGLDIEGLAVIGRKAYLGLRGPVIDSHAVIVELPLERDHLPGEAPQPARHFLDLGGLAVRELARDGKDILVLAGPVTAVDGPFRLHRWRPASTGDKPHRPRALFEWPHGPEKPEGLCGIEWNGRSALLVVYDSPGRKRIDGATVLADVVAKD